MTIIRFYAISFMAAAVFFTPARANAQDAVLGVDGCAILANVVYTEIALQDSHRWRAAGHTLFFPGPDQLTICNNAARSISYAFTKSLRRMNVYISWGAASRGSGDYCESHYLAQCYPQGDPFMPAMGDAELASVMRKWTAVRQAIAPTLVGNLAGDTARFRSTEVRAEFRRSLAGQLRAAH